MIAKEPNVFLILAMVVHIPCTVLSSEETTSLGSAICRMKEVEFRLGTAIEFASKAMESLKGVESVMNSEDCPLRPEDCSVLYSCGRRESGIYTLWPKSRIMENSFQAYCDMATEGGGWTVIQRRDNFGKAEDYFYRNWDAYKEGFGNPSEDFWIGNDILFAITNQKKYSIRFDLRDGEGDARWAKYDHFWIDSEDYNYTLHVSGYTGDATDSFTYHTGGQFSTKDRDNDDSSGKCAVTCKGAWWYKSCYRSSLNSLYLNGYHSDRRYQGINWYNWRHDNYSLPFTEMKIKPLFSTYTNSAKQIVGIIPN